MGVDGNERAAIIGQLVAMDNVLHGILASLQEEQEKPVCAHPEEQRKYAPGVMGGTVRFTCQRCGEEFEAAQPSEDILSRVVRPTNGG
jgi:hypothetical protein